VQVHRIDARRQLGQRGFQRRMQQVERDGVGTLEHALETGQGATGDRDHMQARRALRIGAPGVHPCRERGAIAPVRIENDEALASAPVRPEVHWHQRDLRRKQDRSWSSTMPMPCM
jgi:hypothetical protein